MEESITENCKNNDEVPTLFSERSPLTDCTNISHFNMSGGGNSPKSFQSPLPSKASEALNQSRESNAKDVILGQKNCQNEDIQSAETHMVSGRGVESTEPLEDEDDEEFEDAKENKLSLTVLADNLERIHLTTPCKSVGIASHEFDDDILYEEGSLDLCKTYEETNISLDENNLGGGDLFHTSSFTDASFTHKYSKGNYSKDSIGGKMNFEEKSSENINTPDSVREVNLDIIYSKTLDINSATPGCSPTCLITQHIIEADSESCTFSNAEEREQTLYESPAPENRILDLNVKGSNNSSALIPNTPQVIDPQSSPNASPASFQTIIENTFEVENLQKHTYQSNTLVQNKLELEVPQSTTNKSFAPIGINLEVDTLQSPNSSCTSDQSTLQVIDKQPGTNELSFSIKNTSTGSDAHLVPVSNKSMSFGNNSLEEEDVQHSPYIAPASNEKTILEYNLQPTQRPLNTSKSDISEVEDAQSCPNKSFPSIKSILQEADDTQPTPNKSKPIGNSVEVNDIQQTLIISQSNPNNLLVENLQTTTNKLNASISEVEDLQPNSSVSSASLENALKGEDAQQISNKSMSIGNALEVKELQYYLKTSPHSNQNNLQVESFQATPKKSQCSFLDKLEVKNEQSYPNESSASIKSILQEADGTQPTSNKYKSIGDDLEVKYIQGTLVISHVSNQNDLLVENLQPTPNKINSSISDTLEGEDLQPITNESSSSLPNILNEEDAQPTPNSLSESIDHIFEVNDVQNSPNMSPGSNQNNVQVENIKKTPNNLNASISDQLNMEDIQQSPSKIPLPDQNFVEEISSYSPQNFVERGPRATLIKLNISNQNILEVESPQPTQNESFISVPNINNLNHQLMFENSAEINSYTSSSIQNMLIIENQVNHSAEYDNGDSDLSNLPQMSDESCVLQGSSALEGLELSSNMSPSHLKNTTAGSDLQTTLKSRESHDALKCLGKNLDGSAIQNNCVKNDLQNTLNELLPVKNSLVLDDPQSPDFVKETLLDCEQPISNPVFAICSVYTDTTSDTTTRKDSMDVKSAPITHPLKGTPFATYEDAISCKTKDVSSILHHSPIPPHSAVKTSTKTSIFDALNSPQNCTTDSFSNVKKASEVLEYDYTSQTDVVKRSIVQSQQSTINGCIVVPDTPLVPSEVLNKNNSVKTDSNEIFKPPNMDHDEKYTGCAPKIFKIVDSIEFDQRIADEAANISDDILNQSQEITDSDSETDQTVLSVADETCSNPTTTLAEQISPLFKIPSNPPELIKRSSPSKSLEKMKDRSLRSGVSKSNRDNDICQSLFQSMRPVLAADLNQSEAGPITADELTTDAFQDGATLDLDYFTSVEGTGFSKASESLTRDSLYVKFDPIVGAIVSASVNEKFTMPPPVPQEDEDDTKIKSEDGKAASQCDEAAAASSHTPVRSPALEVVQKLISLTPSSTPAPASPTTAPVKVERSPVVTATLTPKNAVMPPEMQKMLKKLEADLQEREKDYANVLSKNNQLEVSLKSSIEREKILKKDVQEKTKSKQQLSLVIEEYEKTISQLVAQKEEEKKAFEVQKSQLMQERDTATQHLNNMEIAFNDIHQKYERGKSIIEGMKSNEDRLKQSLAEYDEAIKSYNAKYEHLKTHAIRQLETANQELDMMRRNHQAEVAKLKAMLKKAEVKATSFEESLEQKTKENQELAAICDELISKVGSGNN